MGREALTIIDQSESGKIFQLDMIGGMVTPTPGSVILDGVNIVLENLE